LGADRFLLPQDADLIVSQGRGGNAMVGSKREASHGIAAIQAVRMSNTGAGENAERLAAATVKALTK
jgi:hypothetical protein